MAVGYNLGDLRAAIDEINREVVAERGTGEVLNADVLTRLKRTRPHLIEAFTPQLVDMALIKLLNQVCVSNATKDAASAQSALFAGYSQIPKGVAIIRGLKKATEKLTIAEAEEWLESHSNRTVSNDHEGFRKLIDDCRRAAKSDIETIEEILNRTQHKAMFQGLLELAD